MAGFSVPDTHSTVTSTPDAITAAIPGIKPAATALTDLISAANNVPIRVFVLRVSCTDTGAGDTYSIYRLVIGGTPSPTNAICLGTPIDGGEVQAFDNIVINPGDKLVVASTNGRVSFSGDIGEAP